MPNKKLSHSFYQRPDVVEISRDLIGKVLCTQIGDQDTTSGMIVETEAYCGRDDKACHANDGLRTKRTEVMYQPGGVAYVYLCYGIHHLFNVVTNIEDQADAILIRAVEPIGGKKTMATRRNMDPSTTAITAGPGRLSQALGITTQRTGTDLRGPSIWIEDRNINLRNKTITPSPRIGVDYAGAHANRPWRFTVDGNKWVSK